MVVKTFEKVWHKTSLFKIESMNTSGNLMEHSFLSEIFQRVLFNGQLSEWASIKGCVLGPLLLLTQWSFLWYYCKCKTLC